MGQAIKTCLIYFSDENMRDGPPVQLIKPRAGPKPLELSNLVGLTDELDLFVDSSVGFEISHCQMAILSLHVDLKRGNTAFA